MPYRKKAPKGEIGAKGNPHWYVRVPTRNGGSVQMSTKNTDKNMAKRIERMLAQFKSGPKRDYFDLIDAVLAGKLQLVDLLESDDNNALDERRTTLSGVAEAPTVAPDIVPEIKRFEKWLADRVATDTATHYVSTIFTFIEEFALRAAAQELSKSSKPKRPDPTVAESTLTREDLLATYCPVSALTVRALYTWFTDLDVAGTTKRKYHTAMTSFIDHLALAGLFEGDNPMSKVPVPPANDPRTKYLETTEAVRLIQSFADPVYRGFNALMAGSGIEVSVALSVRRRDINASRREIFAPGTKTYTRKRTVRVAEWAWPYIQPLLAGLGPDDRVFAAIPDRWIARDVFNAVVFPLAMTFECYQGYTMRDHRHTYAVRAARAGTPPQIIAKQLGHINGVLVLKVYAQFFPESEDRDRWELKAAKLDEEAGITAATSATAAATAPSTPAEPKPSTKIEWPSLTDLLRMLESTPTRTAAAQLGVSDNALRKHLKRSGVSKVPDGRRSGVTRPRVTTSKLV